MYTRTVQTGLFVSITTSNRVKMAAEQTTETLYVLTLHKKTDNMQRN